MKLTLRQMQYFEALARTRHFARAAEAVHVSQPALSAQIMEMERRLGVKLFDRSRSGVYPTPLAERLLPAVMRILNETRAVEEMAESSAGLLTGKLRLYHGSIPCPAVGRVSMDLITVDVTDLPEDPGYLTLLGPHQGVDRLAAAAGTIGYEVLTSLGNRYSRQYLS